VSRASSERPYATGPAPFIMQWYELRGATIVGEVTGTTNPPLAPTMSTACSWSRPTIRGRRSTCTGAGSSNSRHHHRHRSAGPRRTPWPPLDGPHSRPSSERRATRADPLAALSIWSITSRCRPLDAKCTTGGWMSVSLAECSLSLRAPHSCFRAHSGLIGPTPTLFQCVSGSRLLPG
jgi:hypothetical protein